MLTETITREAQLKCVWTIVRPTTIWGPWHCGMRDGFFAVLRSGWYVHPAGAAGRRSYGFVGNTVFQIGRILRAPESSVRGRTFYLGDQPLNLRDWVGGFSRRLRGQDVREIPRTIMRMAHGLATLPGCSESRPRSRRIACAT